MPCGVTRSIAGVTLTCDNSGSSTHAGRHSGLITFTLFGRQVTGSRVYWENNTARTVFQKVATLGQSDFLISGVTSPIWSGVSTGGGGGSVTFDETTQLATPGTFVFDIPAQAVYIDVILIGGGGSGHSGSGTTNKTGMGGFGGSWASETLQRGVDFPSNATQLNFTIGQGGASPGGIAQPGKNGSITRREAIPGGKAELVAAGGLGGSGYDDEGFDKTGKSPGTHVRSGVTYAGGVAVPGGSSAKGANGSAPGGGGGGGGGGLFYVAYVGGPGGAGRAWVRARTS